MPRQMYWNGLANKGSAGCHLFQEIFAHGSEGIDENTGLQTYATMWQVRSDIIAIASFEYFLLLTDSPRVQIWKI